MSRSYKRGLEFPHEGFLQLSVEEHFRNAGFLLTTDSRVDLICSHPDTGESWHIEAKGVTSQVGLDFRTGLGQLVQAMHSQDMKHGIALPDTPAFSGSSSKVERMGSCTSSHPLAVCGARWLRSRNSAWRGLTTHSSGQPPRNLSKLMLSRPAAA